MTLVWTDPPASVGSTSALIHDLDLVVIYVASAVRLRHRVLGLGVPGGVREVREAAACRRPATFAGWSDLACALDWCDRVSRAYG